MKTTLRSAIVVLSLIAFAVVLRAYIPQVPTGSWAAGVSLNTARSGAAAVFLPDGRVLIAGGTDSNGVVLASAEIVNTDGSVSPAAPMSVARTGAAAIALPMGDVLVTGGTTTADGAITNSAELYDPLYNSWQTLPATMVQPRSGHTTSQLLNGDILIAGGDSSSGPVASLEIFDETNNSFSQVGTLATGRKDHAAAVLNDGRVLILAGTDASGATLASTEIFDINAVGTSTDPVSAGPALNAARAHHSATTLLDGTVLIAGGSHPARAANGGSADLASAEIFDPASTSANTTVLTSSLQTARSGHLAFLLPNNNNVLIVGGTSAGNALALVEMYTPWTQQFSATASMSAARAGATGAALSKVDGLLQVLGGQNASAPALASSEYYGFATVKTDLADYIPGQTVIISGTGWQPGETVTLRMVESPNVDTHSPLYAVADQSGNIYNDQFAPDSHDMGIRFYLTASGSQSQAQNTFTDGSKVGSVSVGAQSPDPVHAGNSATYLITVNRGTGSGSSGSFSVNLSASGLPSGASASSSCVNPCITFAPTDTSKTTTLTISTDVSTVVHSGYSFTVTATRTDNSADNASGSGTLDVSAPLDRTLPSISCTVPDQTVWYASDVTVSCTASDSSSGLANSADASFSLSTSVSSGTETASAATPSKQVCDKANNCATAGPYTFKVDKKAPQLSSCQSPDGNWHSSDVTLTCSYTDGGSGPSTLQVSLTTNAGAGTETSNALASANSAQACDVVGNCAASPSDIGSNKVDKKAPGVSCTSADGQWHGADVQIACTASDSGSGLAVAADGSFNLTTNVPADTETANASTDTHQVCDAVGNCATAGPVTGNMVDKKAPGFSCGSADGTWHADNISIACTASDSGSGLTVSADTSFNLSTNVADGSETSDASTDNHSVCDAVGNCATAGPISGNKIDRKVPTVDCASSDGAWHKDDVSVACTASDGGSGVASAGDASFSLSTNVASGTETADARTGSRSVCDAVGHCSTAGPIGGSKIDKKAPVQTACDAPDGAWHKDNVTLNCTYTDGGSGPAGQQVSLSTHIDAGTETANAVASAGGAQACDPVGNCAVSPADISGNKIDKKPPQLVSCGTPDGKWHAADVTLTCAYSDGGSGAGNLTLNLTTSVAAGTETDNAVASVGGAKSCDAAGNCADSPADIAGNKVDKKAPVVACGAADDVWHADNVSIACTSIDSGSGLSNSADANFSLSATVADNEETSNASTGTHQVCDASGNCSTGGPISGNKIDRKPPTITASAIVNGSPYTGGTWTNQNVTVKFSCNDGGSGVAAGSPPSDTTVTTEGQNQSVNGTCYDQVGNHASTSFTGIDIDKTPPNAPTPQITPPPNAAGWNHSVPVTVTFVSNGDAGSVQSGVTNCTPTASLNGETADTTESGTCADNAGNTSASASTLVKIDITKPIASITLPTLAPNSIQGVYVLNQPVTANYSCSDNLSGVASCNGGGSMSGTLMLNTSTLGVHTVNVIALDVAGNTYTATAIYTVQYAPAGMCAAGPGHQILQPINPDGSSIFRKQGSTIPVKFRVCDANGVAIGPTAVMPNNNFGLVMVAAYNGNLQGTLEDVTSTTPDASFRWDSTSQQWIFNMSTRNLSAGWTYSYQVQLLDGTAIPFTVGLK